MLKNSPLWVATWVGFAHVRVVRGLSNDTVSVNDPLPIGVGRQHTATFADFFGAMEDLGGRERAERFPVYVAYLRKS